MIQCYIDGKLAVPTLKDSIKLVLENPYIKEKDSYTFDVSFPLDIPQNRAVFGALNRLDTSKRVRKFDDCILMADNVSVIRGIGTIIGITREEVKMQILGGSSSLRYRADFGQVFIDRIDYPSVPSKYSNNCVKWHGKTTALIDVDSEIRTKKYVGDISTAVFMPVWDESNQCMANDILMLAENITTRHFISGDVTFCLFNRAVQPNLMMVLRTVLQHMGYTVASNAYDESPWNELVICSARQTAIIAKALPHWTVSKFLDEFRKLFNAALLFDENSKTVRIVRADTMEDNDIVAYEAADDFSSEFDEDGLEYIGSSNIRYNLSGLSDRAEEVPDDVLENFEIREFSSNAELITAFNAMSERQQLTTLMVDPAGFVYCAEVRDSSGRKTGALELRRMGEFTKLVRDSNTDNDITLDICPVAMVYGTYKWKLMVLISGNYHHMDDIMADVWVPVVSNDSVEVGPLEDAAAEDEEERGYVTIDEVIEEGESATSEETEESVTMQLVWPAQAVTHPLDGTNVIQVQVPACVTDWRFGPVLSYRSLALTHAGGYPYVGQFHERVVRINAGATIDGNDEVRIPFLCDGIPNPASIYMFNGKRYLCSKVEVNITQNGIDSLKMGYFYEIL